MKRTYSSLDNQELTRVLSLGLTSGSLKLLLTLCTQADKCNLIKVKENQHKELGLSKSKYYRAIKELDAALLVRKVNIYGTEYLLVSPALRWSWHFSERKRWQFVFENGLFKEDEEAFSFGKTDERRIVIEDYPITLDSTRAINRVDNIVYYVDTGEVACVFPELLIDTSDLKTKSLSKHYEGRVEHLNDSEDEPKAKANPKQLTDYQRYCAQEDLIAA